MNLASRIYRGTVVHTRLRPRPHKLRYDVFTILVDVDAIDALAKRLRLFARNRWNIFSLYDADHGPRDGTPINTYARAAFAAAGFDSGDSRIFLLCYPRVLGYVFNPLSVYYAFDRDERLAMVMYEVSNTFGERRCYVIAAGAGAGGVFAHRCRKELFVSPFISGTARYAFRITRPENDVLVGVQVRDDDGALLKTHFQGSAAPLSDRTLAWLALVYPLMTLKVIAAIHYEALKLYLKGVPLVRGHRSARHGVTVVPAERQG